MTFGGHGIASFWAAAIEEGQKGYDYDGARGAGLSVIKGFKAGVTMVVYS